MLSLRVRERKNTTVWTKISAEKTNMREVTAGIMTLINILERNEPEMSRDDIFKMLKDMRKDIDNKILNGDYEKLKPKRKTRRKRRKVENV